MQTLHFPFSVLSGGFDFVPKGDGVPCSQCRIEVLAPSARDGFCDRAEEARVTLINMMPCSGGEHSVSAVDSLDHYRAVRCKVRVSAILRTCRHD